jgi:hypothetical protein
MNNHESTELHGAMPCEVVDCSSGSLCVVIPRGQVRWRLYMDKNIYVLNMAVYTRSFPPAVLIFPYCPILRRPSPMHCWNWSR